MSAIVSITSTLNATTVAQAIVGSGNGATLVNGSAFVNGLNPIDGNITINKIVTFSGGAAANMTLGSVGSGAQPRLDSGVVVSSGISGSFSLRPLGGPFAGLGSVDIGATGTPDDDCVFEFQVVPDDGMNKLHLEIAFGSNNYLAQIGNLAIDDTSFVRVNGADIFFVPGTSIPIGFNTVYPLGYSAPPLNINGYNHDYYVDNAAITYTGYNGYACVSYDLAVTAGAVYTLQFGIADVGTGLIDSALIIGQLLCSYDPAFIPTPTQIVVLQRPPF